MSHPPQQHQPYAQRPWSPHQGQGASSPLSYGPPPTKRPRLSPGAQSPYGSPGLANISLPNQVFSKPYYDPHSNGTASTNHYHNTINQQPAQQPAPPSANMAGTMGPPSRPSDKPTDLNELSDVLQGSGVDLREEEAAMMRPHAASQQQHHHHQEPSFSSQFSNSFNSTGSDSPTRTSFPRSDYNVYSQNVPGDRASFYGAGTYNQPAVPYQSEEEMEKRQLEQANRRKAEIKQYHLNHPFLKTGPLRQRTSNHMNALHVAQITQGHYVMRKDVQPRQMNVVGPDGHDKPVLLKGQDLLTTDSPWAEILSLLSLATQARIRGFVEDSAALAKSRRIASDGVVPVELKDLVVGDGSGQTVPALPTPSNSAVSPQTNTVKRMCI